MDAVLILGLAGAAFLAGSILPFPSEGALAAAILQLPEHVWLLVAAASIGNIAGAILNWWLGRQVDRFQDRRWFPVSPQALTRARSWYGKYGRFSLLLAWLPVIGDPLTVFGGVMRVPLLEFVVLAGIGKVARYILVAVALL